jgi:PAS domain-containing protein
MNPALNHQHLMLLLGGAALVGCVVIVGVYLLQRTLGSALKPQETKRAVKVRVEDETAFAMATVKGVVTQLKSEQKEMQEKLIGAERRAEESTRKFDLLAREIDYAVIVFDIDGFIGFSNPLVRKLLALDTWSRRRYGEIFQDFPTLAEVIGECFANGTETRRKIVGIESGGASKRQLEISVLQIGDRAGALDAVVCLFRESASAT